jgi:hypothetical protein
MNWAERWGLRVELAEEVRSNAHAEAQTMCCLGTGECGAVECIRDAARLNALLDAANWIEV